VRQARRQVLADLAEAGLVREVHLGAGPVRYDADGGQHHHHRVCRSCGSVDDVPCLAGSGGCLAPHDLGGFGVEQVEITYRGRCVRCQARPAASDEEAR
jgi:Fur family ferric uptake transcriptional regulator